MNKIISLFVCSIALIPLYGGGTVFFDRNGNGKADVGENGIADVVVSNGKEVVKTDADGKFSFKEKGYWITVCTPDKFIPTTAVWQPAGTVNASFGFRQDEAYDKGAAFVHGSDIQFPVARKRGILRNVIKTMSSAAKKHNTNMVICPGDLTPYGDFQDLNAVREEFAKSGLQFYPVFGGHDASKNPDMSNYRKNFGPLWYSWNFRGVHFIAFVSENFLSKTMLPEQYKWFKDDLSMIPADMPIVLATHAPGQASRYIRECLGKREPDLVLRGHYHNWNIRKAGKTHVICSAPWREGDNGAQTVRVRMVYCKNGKWQSATEFVHPMKETVLKLENAQIKTQKSGGNVSDITLNKLVPVWSSKIGGFQDYYGASVISDGKVFCRVSDNNIGAENAGIAALDSANGKVLWKTLLGDDVAATPAVDEKFVYAVTCSGNVAALDKADGKVIWRTAAKSDFGNLNNQTMGRYGWRLTTAPVVCADGKVFCQSNFTIRALDAATGKELWSVFRDSGYSPASGLLYHNGKLYASVLKQILVIDPATGKNIAALDKGKLKMLPAASDRGVALPTVFGNAIYFPGQTLRKFDLNAKELWAVRLSGARYAVSPAVENGGIVFNAHNDSFNAYDAATGKLLWSNKTKSTLGEVMKNTSAPVVFSDKVVYAPDNGTLNVADIKTGKILQNITLGTPVKASLTVSGNLLCVSTCDGRIIGFAVK